MPRFRGFRSHRRRGRGRGLDRAHGKRLRRLRLCCSGNPCPAPGQDGPARARRSFKRSSPFIRATPSAPGFLAALCRTRSSDTSQPYRYLRVDDHPRHQYAIFGGEDHKTGQEEKTELRFQQLEDLFKAHVPGAEVKHRWSGQVVEPHDRLPLIGEIADANLCPPATAETA